MDRVRSEESISIFISVNGRTSHMRFHQRTTWFGKRVVRPLLFLFLIKVGVAQRVPSIGAQPRIPTWKVFRQLLASLRSRIFTRSARQTSSQHLSSKPRRSALKMSLMFLAASVLIFLPLGISAHAFAS